MRVIGGTYRSRLLSAPKGDATRPTSDRLRETLFNILQPRLEGCRFVDLYAGTGAVGIEAISRGAAHVWFAENAPPAVASIRANLSLLKINAGYAIEDRGVGALWPRLQKFTGQIDIVFLDPPYEAETEYLGTLGYLGSIKGSGILSPGALVVAEHTTRTKMPERFGALELSKTRKQGDVTLSFYEIPVDEPNPEPQSA
jgi:16S rRNA (guanine966-N2)-methyltransferase